MLMKPLADGILGLTVHGPERLRDTPDPPVVSILPAHKLPSASIEADYVGDWVNENRFMCSPWFQDSHTEIVEYTAVSQRNGCMLRLTFALKLKLFNQGWQEKRECGGVRQMRTSLCKDSEAAPYATPNWRHSARAAVRLSLKFDRL